MRRLPGIVCLLVGIMPSTQCRIGALDRPLAGSKAGVLGRPFSVEWSIWTKLAFQLADAWRYAVGKSTDF